MFRITHRGFAVLTLILVSPRATDRGRGPEAPAAPSALAFTAVSAGYFHTCALTGTGQAYCWGSGSSGALGTGNVSATAPQPVAGGLTFLAISAGKESTCGLASSYEIYCWGLNSQGQVGDGTSGVNRLVPTRVLGGKKFTSVSLRNATACGVTRTVVGQIGGQLYCWGSNLDGQAGIGTTQSPLTAPQAVVTSYSFAQVSTHYQHVCGVTTASQMVCWGSNLFGRLGNPAITASLTPQLASGTVSYRAAAPGEQHSCGLAAVPPPPPGTSYSTPQATSAWCWGRNLEGELGQGLALTTSLTTPGRIASPAFIALESGGGSSCGITSLNGLYCWGANKYGQLGIGVLGDRAAPVAVLTGLHFSAVSVGSRHTCGLAGGRVYCWGDNFYGQLGTGNTASALTPVLVSGQ